MALPYFISLLIISVSQCYAISIFEGQYVGCFQDGANRDMSGFNQIYKNLTLDFCIAQCRTHGFTYAGVQNTDICHCDDKYGDRPCAGNKSQVCGGDRTNSVYTVCPVGKYGTDCLFDCPMLCSRNGSECCYYGSGKCIYGCISGYSSCDKSEENCYILKADPREEVGELNNNPGRLMNLFSDITIDTPGRISKIDYYADNKGKVFVSFWRKIPDTVTMWAMVGKVEIVATNSGKNFTTVNNDIYVSIGDALAVHYDPDDTQAGVIFYERNSHGSSEGMEEHQLSGIYNLDVRDNGWKPWHVLNIRGKLGGVFRVPALHITLDCLQKTCPDHKYGPECDHDCIPSCINSMCSPLNGECLHGCITGWMGGHCNLKCPNNCQNMACDRFRGLCLEGCAPGFTGDECNEMCQGNTYGYNCTNKCHCAKGKKCSHITGMCPENNVSKVCEDGWVGCNCDIPVASLQKVKVLQLVIVFVIIFVILAVSLGYNLYVILKQRRKYGPIYCAGKNSKGTELKNCDQTGTSTNNAYEPFFGDEYNDK